MNYYRCCAACHFELLEDQWVWWKQKHWHVVCWFHHIFFSMDKEDSMKHIGTTIVKKEIGSKCTCGGYAHKDARLFIDSDKYLVIEGNCERCDKHWTASFALTELQTLIPPNPHSISGKS